MMRSGLVALLVGALALPGCGGNIPIPDDCRLLGCPAGQVCTELEDGTYACRPYVPPPCTPSSCERDPDAPLMCVAEKCVPCQPDLSGAIWNTDAGDVICSTPERPVKHWPPDKECPALTEPCEASPQEGCRFPQGLGDKITAAPSNPGSMGSIVNKAMADLTGCAVGQEPCPISVPVDVWFGAVCEQLRAKGYCCGRHVDTPPGHDVCPPGSGCTDQISVKRTDFCDGKPHENYRVINPQENAVRWYPSAKLDAWNVDCGDQPPPQGQCVPSLTGIRRKMNLHCPGDDPTRKWCDHTPGEGDLARCQAIGLGCMPGTGPGTGKPCRDRHDCPPQTEGHALRDVCENEFYGWPEGQGEPTWSSDGRVAMRVRPDGSINRAMAYTPNGTWIRVCAADGTCSQVGP